MNGEQRPSGQHEPRQRACASRGGRETEQQAGDGSVVVPGRLSLNPLAIQPRMLLVEQRVVHVLALLRHAHAPFRRPDGMDHNCARRGNQPAVPFQQRKEKIAVLPPRRGEALVETADAIERRSAAEAVRRDKFRARQAGRVAFVIGRDLWQRHDQPSPRAVYPVRERRQPLAEPAPVRHAVVIGEGDDLRSRHAPAGIAGRRRPLAIGVAHVAELNLDPVRPQLDQAARFFAGAIVDHDHFVNRCIAFLQNQRREATVQQFVAAAGRNHHRCTQAHLVFSSKNEPITNASSGEAQKHSTASRGDCTIGSLRELNDVLISTGTPVRRWNSRSRS